MGNQYTKYSKFWNIDKVLSGTVSVTPCHSGGEVLTYGLLSTTVDECKHLWSEYDWSGDYLQLSSKLATAIHAEVFWYKPNLHVVHQLSPIVASCIFDMNVTLGVERSVSLVQRFLNAHSSDGSLYEKVDVTGVMDADTMRSLNDYLGNNLREGVKSFVLGTLCLRGSELMDLATGCNCYEHELRYWLSGGMEECCLEYLNDYHTT